MATPVKAARLVRGWTQKHMVAQLREAAAGMGERLPADESVRQQVCRFERGVTPGPFYRSLLCAVFASTPETLGWSVDPADADPVRFHAGRTDGRGRFGRRSWVEVPDTDAVTALLYAVPLDTARLARQSRTRLALYVRLVDETSQCPERHTLAAGLRRARAHQPPWLDRDRLDVCERLAATLVGPRTIDPAAERVPDWLTGARLAAGSRAAQLFSHTA